ncbi:hypothetical protein BN1221_04614c [Brenneria goodwinii]|uniref:Uncharacterized protein n=1 Tax=Brenneria goodwinii TaxID=1109412 RepID=A0A0G4K1R0_9GAMM|nr:hypothetical protein BN1221_04614c [Brenneria goodwinii]
MEILRISSRVRWVVDVMFSNALGGEYHQKTGLECNTELT